LILSLFYIALLSEWIPLLLFIFLCKSIRKPRENVILIWFATKCFADLGAMLANQYFKVNFFPIFHISLLIENICMFLYIGNYFVVSHRKRLLLSIIPFLVFVLEISLFGSFFELSKLSVLTYNASVSILFLILLLNGLKIEKREFSFILNLFVFHSISFVYFLFDQIRRYNDYISENIYPVYIVFVVFLNLHFLFYVWSMRKK